MGSIRQLGTLSSETFLISFIERIDRLLLHDDFRIKSMSQEVKSLEFWRSLIAECLSTFFYVFLVCAVNISWTGSLIGHTPNWIVMSLTSGLAMAILTQCFGHISGSHVNPAVTCAFLVTRNITPLRSLLYIIAQSGGAIAGAALLYGVSVPGHQGALGIALAHEALGPGQIFGVEFVLTFLIVFTIFATLDINRKSMGNDSITIGSAYMVCSLTGLPASGASFNPARALGPAFVMNKWKHHWVYWIAPITGSMLAGLIYEFIFDSRKSKTLRSVIDDIDKHCNEDHYDEPEVKMSNKSILGFPLGGSSNSGSSSSSTHQSNTTGYSSITSGLAHQLHHPHHQQPAPAPAPPLSSHHPPLHHQPPPPGSSFNHHPHSPATNNNTFQHTVITHDGLYMANPPLPIHNNLANNNNNSNSNNNNSNVNNNNSSSHINTSNNNSHHLVHNNSNSSTNHVTPLLSSSTSSSSAASASNYQHPFNGGSYAGIYGTRTSTLRHLSNRMDYNTHVNNRNEITPNNISQPGKY